MNTTVAINERKFGPKMQKVPKKIYALRQLTSPQNMNIPSSQL
jgi:hypothetical protein